jgi:hypothetical protein
MEKNGYIVRFKADTTKEIIDPPRQVCIITMDGNDNELYREYLGSCPSVTITDNLRQTRNKAINVEKAKAYTETYNSIWVKLEKLIAKALRKKYEELS